MSADDPFGAWLDRLASLSDAEVDLLPDWQQPMAVIHQFGVIAACDGPGALFYNEPEAIDALAEAFLAVGEPELADWILRVEAILEPFAGEAPFNESEAVLQQCLDGAATADIIALDALFQARVQAIYATMEARAREMGWRG